MKMYPEEREKRYFLPVGLAHIKIFFSPKRISVVARGPLRDWLYLSTILLLTSYLLLSDTSPSAVATKDPALPQEKETLGAPLARHVSTPVEPLSDADLDRAGDTSMVGLAMIQAKLKCAPK